MGFDFSLRRDKIGWETARLALQTYKDLNGHLLIPAKYQVPSGDMQWSEKLWGMKLGKLCSGIRIKSKSSYKDHREEILAMGFVFERQKKRSCYRKPIT